MICKGQSQLVTSITMGLLWCSRNQALQERANVT